jgi:hypothetical protein
MALPLAGAMALVAGLSACGETAVTGDGRTAQQVLVDSGSALQHARSYHVESDTQSGVVVTQYVLDVAGANADGILGQDGRWTLHITLIGDVLYARGQQYWATEISRNAASVIGDRCVRIDGFNQDSQALIRRMKVYSDTNGYAKSIASTHGDVNMGSATLPDGTKVITVTDNSSTVTMDAGKDSYPLRIEEPFGDNSGHTDFSRFNEHGPIVAPTGCLDLASLSTAGGATPSPAIPAGPGAPSPAPSATPVDTPAGSAQPGPPPATGAPAI